ncbi:hypothetical protein [Phocaeicola sartorii]|uniref:hypothetical protein n=1 Tax=Phocaeicola sartorii TaxID=671267 RepID=UPI00351283F0
MVNKKAILGMLVMIVTSLGVMKSMNNAQSEPQQCWSLMMAYGPEMSQGESAAAGVYGTVLSTAVGCVNPLLGLGMGL